jgi:hypothetical protein
VQLTGRINASVLQILAATQGVDYPFSHARGTVELATFLGESEPHENPLVQTFLRGQTVLDRFLSTYFRAISRLTVLAKSAEASLEHAAAAEPVFECAAMPVAG